MGWRQAQSAPAFISVCSCMSDPNGDTVLQYQSFQMEYFTTIFQGNFMTNNNKQIPCIEGNNNNKKTCQTAGLASKLFLWLP